MATGQIFDIQRFSIHDGPGIRTTVFLKGCPLQCLWCHNPEGIDRRDQLSFLPDKCIGCGWCFRACESDAHEMVEGEHIVDREKCVICGQCASNCHARALEIIGREVTAEEC
ncbi:MAG: 4Fe-4S binding protein, partial [Planctomycetota bacterium]